MSAKRVTKCRLWWREAAQRYFIHPRAVCEVQERFSVTSLKSQLMMALFLSAWMLVVGMTIGESLEKRKGYPCESVVTLPPATMTWECTILNKTNPPRLSCALPEGAVIEISTDKGQSWVKVDYLRINQQTLSPRFPVPSGR